MKKILALFIGMLFISSSFAQANKVIESTKKKFNIGVDVFTDIWQITGADGAVTPNPRTINQGANVFGMYNNPIGKSNFSFAVGLGLGMHNLYSDSKITDLNADIITFEKIPNDVNYKKSKISLTYLDLPAEIRLATKSDFRVSLGVKVGYLLNSHTKYSGDEYSMTGTTLVTGSNVVVKRRGINNTETWRYGATFRIGYKWVNLMAYYQISELFKQDRGPKISPISVGISLTSF